jgi:hypothetical protein
LLELASGEMDSRLSRFFRLPGIVRQKLAEQGQITDRLDLVVIGN